MVKNIWKKDKFAFVLLALFIVLPLIFKGSADLQNTLIYILIYAIVGEGWNLISGFTGQTSFGHAAYFGIGAYTAAVLGNKYDITPWLGMLAGVAVAGLLAFVLNYKLFSLKGHYFAIATMAVCEIMKVLFSVWTYVGSGDGIKIKARTADRFYWMALNVRDRLPFFFITLGLFVLVFILCRVLEESRYGFYWKAIRESHEAAESIGVNPQKYKSAAMVFSAMIAAVGGTLYAQFFKFIDPSIFSLDISMIFVLVTVLGGIGSCYGPIIGSIIYYALDLLMRRLMGGSTSGINLIIFGVLLVAVVCYQPRGIVGIIQDVKHKVSKKKEA